MKQVPAVATLINYQIGKKVLEIQQMDEIETMSPDSDQTFAVPAIIFKRYLAATSVRYIQMRMASKVQQDDQWDLEETVRQVERKFSTDLRTNADETPNDEKLSKTLVYIERRHREKIPDAYTDHKKNLSMRFGVVCYDNKFVVPKPLRQTVFMLQDKVQHYSKNFSRTKNPTEPNPTNDQNR